MSKSNEPFNFNFPRPPRCSMWDCTAELSDFQWLIGFNYSHDEMDALDVIIDNDDRVNEWYEQDCPPPTD